MKATHGHTHKHAGGTKHAGSAKHKPSAKQLAARKKFQQGGAHAAHLHAVAKHAGHPIPKKWSPHAEVACCAVEALAASLRLTGREVTDADVLELYWRITDDPDAGATISAAAEAASRFGLGGIRLLDARPARQLSDGVAFGVQLEQSHALTVDGHGVWTWGGWRPVPCGLLTAADEAWELVWAGAVD